MILSQKKTSRVFVCKETENLVSPPARKAGIPVKTSMYVAEMARSVRVELVSHEAGDLVMLQNFSRFQKCFDVSLTNADVIFVIKKDIVAIEIFCKDFFVRERKRPRI